MKDLQEIDVIAVKDKNDVLRAAELFEKIGIKVFGSEESKKKFIKTGDDVNNNFLMRDKDGSCRIQSHFISNGITVDELEQKINELIPQRKILNEILLEEIQKDFNKLKKDIIKIEDKLNELCK